MLKKILLACSITLTLFTLTGCGAAPSNREPASESTITASESSTLNPDINMLIKEQPVSIEGKRAEELDNGHSYTMYMQECEIESIDDTTVTARGILADNSFRTVDAVTVTYQQGIADDGTFSLSNPSAPSELIPVTPVVPFTMDLLYDTFTELLVFEEGKDEYFIPLDRSYTLELTPEDWIHYNSSYRGYLKVTAPDGTVYQTINPFPFLYKSDKKSDAPNPYYWGHALDDDFIAVKPIESEN